MGAGLSVYNQIGSEKPSPLVENAKKRCIELESKTTNKKGKCNYAELSEYLDLLKKLSVECIKSKKIDLLKLLYEKVSNFSLNFFKLAKTI